jgi:NitT/TauT family transport system permease protein
MQDSTLPTPINALDHPERRISLPSNLRIKRQSAPWITLLVMLLLWQIVTMLNIYPAFIIPTPLSVIEKLWQVILDGRLWLHTQATLIEVLMGLGLGLTIGSTLGYLIAKTPLLEDILSPIIVSLQSMPVVAYAPLLVIWFGSGPTSKVITGALIVFFPILMNTIVGIRNVPSGLRDLMRSMQATRWQMFTRLEVPAAMPVLIGGLKISATLAVIGAVVGEFVSANTGLGVLITQARSQYDTPLVIVAVLALTLMARALYGAVLLLERHTLAWQLRSKRS